MAWNRPSEKTEVKRKSPSKLRGAWAGLAVVVLAGIGAWWFLSGGGREASRPAEKDTGLIKAVKPAPAKKVVAEKPKKERVEKPKTAEDVMSNLETLPKPAIKMREISPEEWDRLTNRTFKTGVEQLMSWVFSTQPGDMPIPIPNIGEEEKRDIAAILITKNKVTEKDDEMTAFCKEQVDFAKKEMAKYIGEGGDPDSFLQYYFQELKLAFDKRNDAIQQLSETKEEDPELAEQLREAINKKFEEEGIKTIGEKGY